MPSNEKSPSDRSGSREKKPFQDNRSPPSVIPEKAYRFLLPESVLKSRRVISRGSIVRSKGIRSVRSVNEAFAPVRRSRFIRQERRGPGAMEFEGIVGESLDRKSTRLN